MKATPRITASLALALAAFAGVARAHPGHSHSDIPSLIRHPFAGPEHLIGSLAIGLAVGGLLYWATLRTRLPAFARWTGALVVAAGVTLGLSV